MSTYTSEDQRKGDCAPPVEMKSAEKDSHAYRIRLFNGQTSWNEAGVDVILVGSASNVMAGNVTTLPMTPLTR